MNLVKKKSSVHWTTALLGLIGLGLLMTSCVSPSFYAFKKKMVERTDEVIVTFYDSNYMNMKTVGAFLAFSVDNREEVRRFQRFIQIIHSRKEDCAKDGQLVFVDENKQTQRIAFNLSNRCVTVYTDDNGNPRIVQKRLSRRGIKYLEQKKAEAKSRPPIEGPVRDTDSL